MAAALLLLLLLGLAAWVGPRALSAKRHLEAAKATLAAARTALTDRRLPEARAAIAAAGADTEQARHLTHDPAWSVLGHIPYLGRTFRVVSGLSQAADDIARTVLPRVLTQVSDLDPQKLRRPDGSVDLTILHRVRPALGTAADGATHAEDSVKALPDSLVLGKVDTARRQLLALATQLAQALRAASDAVGVAPALLGEDRPRTYFVLVQQTSESRGTGGLPGGYAILRADAGHLHVLSEGSNSELVAGDAPVPDSVPADFRQRYGVRGGFNDWRNVNLSPDLPVVARMVLARWGVNHPGHLDGVIAVDAQGLADLLRGSAPVDVGGGHLVAPAELPAYLGLGQYAQFSDSTTARKESLVLVAHAASHQLTSGGGSQLALLHGLVDAVGTGHLKMASDDPALTATLARTGVDGALPQGSAPVAYPVIFNTTGGKLDYFLSRSVDYRAGSCDGGRRQSTVTTRLTSVAPASGLPSYVTIRATDGTTVQSYIDQVDLSVFTTRGARLVSATLDGKPLSTLFGRSDPVLQVSSEDGLPIWEVVADVAPGQTRTLVLTLDEPVVRGAARVPEQALSSPLVSSIEVPACR